MKYVAPIAILIIKITISSIMIGLKNFYFPLIHLPSCYRTAQQTNQIQSCSSNQPIILMINKSDSRCAVVRFCYHSHDHRPNWTPLSPITITNHKNYNFLNCDWFKKLIFSTNSLAKLLSDSLLSDSLLSRTVQQTNQIRSCSLNQPITFKAVV